MYLIKVTVNNIEEDFALMQDFQRMQQCVTQILEDFAKGDARFFEMLVNKGLMPEEQELEEFAEEGIEMELRVLYWPDTLEAPLHYKVIASTSATRDLNHRPQKKEKQENRISKKGGMLVV